jgi:hypothetical protein
MGHPALRFDSGRLTFAIFSATRYFCPSFSSSAITQSVMQGVQSAYKQSIMPCSTQRQGMRTRRCSGSEAARVQQPQRREPCRCHGMTIRHRRNFRLCAKLQSSADIHSSLCRLDACRQGYAPHTFTKSILLRMEKLMKLVSMMTW